MSNLCKALLVGLLTGVLGLSLVPIASQIEEDIGLDFLFKQRGARDVPSDVIIVTMDRVSARNLNLPPNPRKWPRSLHARLVETLAKQGAAVIAFDVFFDEARSLDHDSLFADAIKNARNVVLCECVEKETISLTDKKGAQTGHLHTVKLVPPIPLLAQSAIALAPFVLPKVPVKVSQCWRFKQGAGDKPTLPMVVFQIFALKAYDEFVHTLKKIAPYYADKMPIDTDEIINTKRVEQLAMILRNIFDREPLIAEKMLDELEDAISLSLDPKKYQVLKALIRIYQGPRSCYLNFYGPPGTIATISYYQLLQDQEKPALKQKQLDINGKAVFIGVSERLQLEQKDGFYTVFSQATGLDISGVEIAATAFANMLEDMSVEPLGLRTHLATIFLWGAGLGILCFFLPTLIAGASIVGLSAVYLVVAQYQFNNTASWYPLVIPLLFQGPLAFFLTLIWKYFNTHKERENIRKAFGYYLPDKVVDQVARNISHVGTSSQMVYGTCLCTDAEKYATLSETMNPKELSSFMNRYYEAIFQPVIQHSGIVSDVVGDSMLSIWATRDPDVALRNQACLAALDITTAIRRFNQASAVFQLPTRIGLHSGRMVLGNIGTIDHYEYRAVGDVVNSASRLEGLNKYLGTMILVSKEVLHELNGFLTRRLGEFLLAGKTRPIVVYELICRLEESKKKQKALCAIFDEAVSAYRNKSWDKAIEKFYECMRIYGKDGPAAFYAKLCKKYKEKPPKEMWNGLISLNKK
ncbi:MAG: adenylate/guanylate cyclase domain-containing protein [Desulfobacteraceae bacterium]|nr:adenylate/guanylate cyclase domain-containing protein [Desulfobacteraceae bacterium]MBC2718620.1 adenylate/guanylate cyclase domain-containing protein [Desulfobacteraceae bacterium]